MARPMSARQRAALKKAQAASAAKRRGTGKKRPSKGARREIRSRARREIRAARNSAGKQHSRHGTNNSLGVTTSAALGIYGVPLQNRGYSKKGKAKIKKASEIEAKKMNAVNEAKNKKKRALGKKGNKKTNYTAKQALKRKRRQALAVGVAVTAASTVHSLNKASVANGGTTLGKAAKHAANQKLHKVASNKRAKTGAANYAAKRGIGTAKANAKTRKSAYSRPKGRKQTYKITTAKKARTRRRR